MNLLTKNQVLDSTDTRREEVYVEEWGGSVLVSTMSGQAKDAWELSVMNKDKSVNMDNIRAKYLAACLVNEDGTLMFTQKDVEALGRKSAGAIDKVFAVAQRLNATTEQDIEKLAKN